MDTRLQVKHITATPETMGKRPMESVDNNLFIHLDMSHLFFPSWRCIQLEFE